MPLARILLLCQAVLSSALIAVGSLVEATGRGLSLGTSWPYRRDLLRLAARGDAEAWHRLIATTLGLVGIGLVALRPDRNMLVGLAFVAGTALLGVATLHVLAGRAPAFLHGLHGLLAYGSLCTYVSESLPGSPPVWDLLAHTIPLHAFLLVVFLGGMVSGRRGVGVAIGAFVVPRSARQWVLVVHVLGWLLLTLTLGYSAETYSAALCLALVQALLGFALYQSVNARPGRPGVVTVFHQAAALLIFFSIVFAWQIRMPFLG